MNEQPFSGTAPRREIVERYCPVIDENTVLIRHYEGNRAVCECVHRDKCKGRENCRHTDNGR